MLTYDLNRKVAAEIRAELARQDMSGARLAEALGWTRQALYRRLNGRLPITLLDLEQISRALGVQFTALIPQPQAAAS